MEKKKGLIGKMSTLTPYPTLRLPRGVRSRLVLTSDSDTIENWILQYIGPPISTNKNLLSVPKKTISFDAEWKPDIHKWKNNPIAIIQLGVLCDDDGLFFSCSYCSSVSIFS